MVELLQEALIREVWLNTLSCELELGEIVLHLASVKGVCLLLNVIVDVPVVVVICHVESALNLRRGWDSLAGVQQRFSCHFGFVDLHFWRTKGLFLPLKVH